MIMKDRKSDLFKSKGINRLVLDFFNISAPSQNFTDR